MTSAADCRHWERRLQQAANAARTAWAAHWTDLREILYVERQRKVERAEKAVDEVINALVALDQDTAEITMQTASLRAGLTELQMTYEPAMVAGEPELTVATRISGPEKDRLVQSLVDRLEALRGQNRQQQLRQLTRAAAWG